MATISSAGIGSGLNVESIISSLMSVEKQPLTQLQTQQSTTQSKISALGTVKSALATLQTAAKALTPATGSTATASLSAYKATLADSTIATATTNPPRQRTTPASAAMLTISHRLHPRSAAHVINLRSAGEAIHMRLTLEVLTEAMFEDL